MRFRVDHPTDVRLRAEYGWDPIAGFFVEAWFEFHEKPTMSFSAIDDVSYDQRRPLWSALEFLAQLRFFSHPDLQRAIALGDERLPEEMPQRLRRIAEIIANFKAAAD